ncbi:GNAT family N-acetyltransferase [Pedobacter sp. V48]|uniref:GNAT family N-acetyltransferase n=1 Tax=Pedobacter sp. V48 TaxID=509635 RepID=UPI0003E5A05C|nr:GNAT family N-acetyltransferase [Pedobacter sp. V48]ETZ22774.1 hypothetical protein N824_21010 [Pedobacter sp. V48]
MIKAKIKDKERIIEILSQAFEQNPGVNAVITQDHKKTLRINCLMRYVYQLCYLFGKILISDDGMACALVLYPGRMKFSLRVIGWNLNLMCSVLGFDNALKILRQEALIRRQYPRNSYYLWFIGVDRSYTNMGIGSDLMEELIADADRRSRPICLETTSGQLNWFKKLGFELSDETAPAWGHYSLRRQAFKYFLE